MGLPSPGSPCPPFSIMTAVTNRAVTLKFLEGHNAVLVVHGARSTDAPKDIARAVRSRSMDPMDPILASIVDLRSMAGIWRKVAEAQIRSSYEKLASKLPQGADPALHILICPDWDGSVALALGVTNADKEPAAIVVGPNGMVKQAVTGKDMPTQVLGLLG